jgi:hypothetical protein
MILLLCSLPLAGTRPALDEAESPPAPSPFLPDNHDYRLRVLGDLTTCAEAFHGIINIVHQPASALPKALDPLSFVTAQVKDDRLWRRALSSLFGFYIGSHFSPSVVF